MHSDLHNTSSTGTRPEVLLDGVPLTPPPERHSLAALRSYLETLALEQQRILYSFRVDGKPLSLVEPLLTQKPFLRVEGRSLDPAQMPLQLVRTAGRQTAQARIQVLAAVTFVLINETQRNREYWWNLAQDLKQPLLTLSLMPEDSCGAHHGGASLMQLRKWQLQQLAAIIKDVDKTCWSDDPTALSNALEERVLPWLNSLQQSLELLQETLSLGLQPTCTRAEPEVAH